MSLGNQAMKVLLACRADVRASAAHNGIALHAASFADNVEGVRVRFGHNSYFLNFPLYASRTPEKPLLWSSRSVCRVECALLQILHVLGNA